MTATAMASVMTSTPGRTDRLGGGLALAVLVHAAILGMLVWNVHFQSDDAPSVASAEIWSSTPQIAAPRAQAPAPTVAPTPPPAPVAKPAPPPPDDTAALRRDADIAVAQQKAKEAEKAEREQRLAEQRKADAAAKAQAAERAEQKARQRQAEQDAQRKQADADAKARQATDARQARRDDDARERQRLENLRRITGMAGASGDAAATGTALHSAGFSASYAGRIAGRIKPNVVFPDALQGNPAVEVELRMSSDGHISTRRITKPSGVAEWDQAVLRAIDRTEVLPADEQGRVPPVMTLIFRPKDLGA